jgi:methylenetetrahydrofolate dehydrogenase (NADP+)/methenyltetrahydrofolate cyclohydrolase
MPAQILDGKQISKEIRQNLKIEVDKLPVKPGLTVVLVGEDPASQVYVNNKEKACKEIGFYSEKIILPESTSKDELMAVIDRLNTDPKIHGILCQFPLPSSLRSIENDIIHRINPSKDVDGFHPMTQFTPCTPKGIIELIKRTGMPITGKHAVVMGRSHMVGKPVAMLLLAEDATITITHSKTQNLKEILLTADIIVAAIGKPKYVTADMVKPGAIIVDVGINRTEEGLVGDVDYHRVREKVSFITPVPGGVGPMTIAMLMQNVLLAYQLSSNSSK